MTDPRPLDRPGPVPAHRERPSTVPGATVWSNVPVERSTGLVVPDGCMDLLWHDGDGDGAAELLVAGPDTRAHSVERLPGVRWTGLRLPPGHAPALLGIAAHELRDARVPLADLWGGARARRLTEQVAATVGRAGTALEAIVAGGPAPDPLVGRTAQLLAAGGGVGEVADELGVGSRRLHRLGLAAFGYPPQTLGRILRVGRAVHALRRGRPVARVAAETGFADQAHLSREVRTFTGTTPRAFGRPAVQGPQLLAANRSTDPPSGSRTVA